MTTMTHSYQSQYPHNALVDCAIVQFFERVYETMDNPKAHEEYVYFYSNNATLIMASTAVQGHEGLFQNSTSTCSRFEIGWPIYSYYGSHVIERFRRAAKQQKTPSPFVKSRIRVVLTSVNLPNFRISP